MDRLELVRVVLVSGLVLVGGLSACDGATVPSAPSPTSALSPATTSLLSGSTGPTAPAVDQVFSELAKTSTPLMIFAPTVLPEGTALADSWLPVLESADPGTYEGPPAGNPKVLGSGVDAEIQVIFQAGDGWLAILENFRGDLGDVKGTPVGSVAGNPAALYEVNGGELVQWSKGGLWYGVFGRGVGRDDVVAVALGMRPAPAKSR